ncbi:AlbA family DNA-binding domain-containing protein [Pseudoroseomonas sp. WGS1072]|uniref:AlbA family DNA-binding domain-containing protein n=1 Tax=Roseomonas sp. WGS1072 TaxID=3366816 RepID=UPI003BF0D617
MKNRDIQFFFNRPGRAVNTGRITDIASGRYSNSSGICRASDEDLNAFLASHKPSTDVPLDVAPAEAEASSPLSDTSLRRMFITGAKGVWRLSLRETDQAECKTSFGLKHPAPWLRAAAALANNRGGYVFFGVGDKDPDGAHPVVGLATDDFANTDPAEIARRLRATFNPTPRLQRALFEVGGKKVGVLHVEQHPSRPIIATKNEGGGDIREGDIFFRYPGQSTRISYADLRAMLDARDAQARADILPMVQRLLALGPDRAMIADLAEGQLLDGKRTIELDEDIIKGLSLIKEGEFVEKAGAPALRLIGDVKTSSKSASKKGLVMRSEMQRDFLANQLTADPLDYVRCAIEVPGNDWLPIRFFARAAGMSNQDLLTFIECDAAAIPAQVTLYKARLSSTEKAYVRPQGPAVDMLTRLLKETIRPRDIKDARIIAQALQGLQRPLPIKPEAIRLLLTQCLDLISKGHDNPAKTAIRKAIARFDEVTS